MFSNDMQLNAGYFTRAERRIEQRTRQTHNSTWTRVLVVMVLFLIMYILFVLLVAQVVKGVNTRTNSDMSSSC